MSDTIRLARTDTYEHTVAGLLKKRAELFNEAERLRDRQAEIRNDVEALDRVLSAFGYTGDLDAEMPRQKRQVLFGTGELTRAILDTLREAGGPMPSRDIAATVVSLRGQDDRDRRLLTEITRRVSKALRSLRADGTVRAVASGRGGLAWCLAQIIHQ